jgi:hypothetical protein
MMNIGGSDGLMALVQMVQSPGFTLKREAVQAIIAAGTSMEMGAFLQSLFQHVDVETARILFDEAALALDIRLMAESLPEVEIAGGLFLHTLPETPYRLVAVSRRLGARIGLFGGSLSFRPGAYLESPDGAVAVDTRASERFALVTRRLPGSAGVIGPLTCSYRLADIVQVLCGKPDSVDLTRGGCGLPYAELLPLLGQMCSQGMVDAPFHAGPGSEIVQ